MRLADFLGLDLHVEGMKPVPCAEYERATFLRGVAVYSLHRTLTAVRCGTIHGPVMAKQAFAGFAADSAGSCAQAAALICRARMREREE